MVDITSKTGKQYSWQDLDHIAIQAQQGDQEAHEELFSFLRARLLVLARHRVSEGAEDVVQETLIVVYERFSELENLGRLLAFANQVLRNKIGNVYQKRDRAKDMRVGLEEIREPGYYIDDELDAVELQRIIRQSISVLRKKYSHCAAILWLLYDGLSADEISHRLGISKSMLKVRTFRCRQALRETLLKEYGLRV